MVEKDKVRDSARAGEGVEDGEKEEVWEEDGDRHGLLCRQSFQEFSSHPLA